LKEPVAGPDGGEKGVIGLSHRLRSVTPTQFTTTHTQRCRGTRLLPLDPINLHHLYSSDELLSFFMGKNTQERQEFIIENLRVEKDLIEAAG